MAATAIAMVEPQMEGVAHAPFNAALLHTVAIAYPDARLRFHAMPSHTQAVQQILSQHAPSIVARIDWQNFPPPGGRSVAARWGSFRSLLRAVLDPQTRTLFCSISRMQLLQLKGRMRMRNSGEVRAVLHGELDLLDQALPSRWRPFSLNRVLLSRQPARLRYLLLGHSILDNIPAMYRRAFQNAGVCDHPYHFAAPSPAPAGPPVFGIFGNAGDGHLLESVASSIKATHPAVRFRLVGFVTPSAVERLQNLVEDVGCVPITRDAFIARANSITYALWLAPAGSFRLRASGTFFDALSYVKPLVYTANPFIDEYHALEPGIGLRCETLTDVERAIRQLVEDHSAEAFTAQQAAILRLRERFTPAAQAKQLASALDWD